MKILVTGNTGYIGPVLGGRIKAGNNNITLVGYDTGFFLHCLTAVDRSPDLNYDIQYYGDIRKFDKTILNGVDVVIHLAAISNDPMGNNFSDVTDEINSKASEEIAKKSKEAGVKKFIFASSCSMYGSTDNNKKKESDSLNPLTAYAKSKVYMEKVLESLADDNFEATCLRYSTACGMSPRLRLDLVLNDFVACALVTGTIQILSDGTPWRPLIDVQDMVRSMEWAIQRTQNDGGNFIAVNVGRNEWNYQVVDLANEVAKRIPGTKIEVNKEAAPDKRSYQVDFSLYASLAPNHLPSVNLAQSIDELAEGLKKMNFKDPDFRSSEMMRLKVLQNLKQKQLLNENLYWNF
ncbi:SDR family oxidoreductase [Candidatus Thioglobus sp.]|nr:SDR family oxidoreductase [Candidatus Thioglobus sp.]